MIPEQVAGGDRQRRNPHNSVVIKVKKRKRAWLAGLALAVCVALAACGGDGDASNGDANRNGNGSEPPDVAALLDTAVQQFAEVKSAHFALDFDGGSSPLEQLSIDMEAIEGDVIVPDRLRAEVQAKASQLGGMNVTVEIVGVGADAWVTNPFDRTIWLPLEGGNPLNGLFNPTDGVAAVIRGTADPAVRGEDELEGMAMWMVEGTIDSGDLTAFLPTAEAGHAVTGTIWIGKADNVIYRIHLRGRLATVEPADILRRLNFSNFDNVDPIEPP